MMGRQTRGQEQLFYECSLDEVVPADHLVRRIDAVLDTSWVHQELAPFYSTLGRPSIDPELMIRMLIVGYVFAIRSERDKEPVFIMPAFAATAKSAMVVSSVSPERCDSTTPKLDF